jgi:hypothetical protein
MSETRKRRWYQFGLRELLWMILAVALAVVALREHQQRLRADAEAEELRELVENLQWVSAEQHGIIKKFMAGEHYPD